MTQITTIIFDIGGVIYRAGDGPLLREKWAPLCNLSHQEFDDIVFRDPLFSKSVIGEISSETLWERKNEKLKLSAEALAELRNDNWNGVWDAELLDFIKSELKPYYKLGILSDANSGTREKVKPYIDFSLFASVIFSYEVGMCKPDPNIFRLALNRLCVKPEETIFIDDRKHNVAGAIDVGMQAILYEEFGPFKRDLESALTSI